MTRSIGIRLSSGILLLIISIFLISLGIILTITLVFWFIGIPMLIIGVIILVAAILTIVAGTFGSILSLIKKPFRKEKNKGKIIEFKKVRGVYRVK